MTPIGLQMDRYMELYVHVPYSFHPLICFDHFHKVLNFDSELQTALNSSKRMHKVNTT